MSYKICVYCWKTSQDNDHYCNIQKKNIQYLGLKEYINYARINKLAPIYINGQFINWLNMYDIIWCNHCGDTISTGGNDMYYMHKCPTNGKKIGYIDAKTAGLDMEYNEYNENKYTITTEGLQ